MRGKYHMMDWELTRATNMVSRAINDLMEFEIDSIKLSHEDIGPYHVRQALENLGYTLSDVESNSYDYWWYFTKEDAIKVCVFFDARIFELDLSLCFKEDI